MQSWIAAGRLAVGLQAAPLPLRLCRSCLGAASSCRLIRCFQCRAEAWPMSPFSTFDCAAAVLTAAAGHTDAIHIIPHTGLCTALVIVQLGSSKT